MSGQIKRKSLHVNFLLVDDINTPLKLTGNLAAIQCISVIGSSTDSHIGNTRLSGNGESQGKLGIVDSTVGRNTEVRLKVGIVTVVNGGLALRSEDQNRRG